MSTRLVRPKTAQKASLTGQAQFHSKSVHPVRQVHQWLGPGQASLPPVGDLLVSCPMFGTPKSLVIKVLAPTMPDRVKHICSSQVCSFRLSLHVVGNLVCLVLLWPNTVRRDNRCPLYRVRNFGDTNHSEHLKQHCRLVDTCYAVYITKRTAQKDAKLAQKLRYKLRNGDFSRSLMLSKYLDLRNCAL